jgi:hypothetical protein
MNGSGFAGKAKPQVTWYFITNRSRAVRVGGSLGPPLVHRLKAASGGRARLEPATIEM